MMRLVADGVSKSLKDVTGAMQITVDTNRMTLESANPVYGISRAYVPFTSEQPVTPFTLLVPKAALEVLDKLFVGQSLAILRDASGDNAAFQFGNTVVSTQLMYGAWPTIDPIFQMPTIAHTVLSREQLLGIMSLILINHNGKDITPVASLRFTDESVHIEAYGNTNDGSAYADIRVDQMFGVMASVRVNAKQLHSVVKELDSKQLFIGITDKGFVRIQAPNDDSYVNVASPIADTLEIIDGVRGKK